MIFVKNCVVAAILWTETMVINGYSKYPDPDCTRWRLSTYRPPESVLGKAVKPPPLKLVAVDLAPPSSSSVKKKVKKYPAFRL